jgi:hypothetical protein
MFAWIVALLSRPLRVIHELLFQQMDDLRIFFIHGERDFVLDLDKYLRWRRMSYKLKYLDWQNSWKLASFGPRIDLRDGSSVSFLTIKRVLSNVFFRLY